MESFVFVVFALTLGVQFAAAELAARGDIPVHLELPTGWVAMELASKKASYP